MSPTTRNAILNGSMVLIESSNFLALLRYYTFHAESLPALLLAASFTLALVAITILLARGARGPQRKFLILAGALTFLVQAFAHIGIAYFVGREHLPANLLAELYGGTAREWYVRSAFLYGGVINIVGFLLWWGIGSHFNEQEQAVEESYKDLFK